MTTIGKDTTITWLGHGTFHLVTPEGHKVLIDAWLDGNPACPDEWKTRALEGLDAIFVTHAHMDHTGDLASTATKTGAQVACIFDMAPWLGAQGIAQDKIIGFNKGGTITVAGVQVTMTTAHHSSTVVDENGKVVNLGDPAGFILRMSNGFTIYHTGDTCVHYDMKIISELYKPDLTILPIGDHFTMGPRQAAYALKLIGSRYAIPEHWGTFPLLTGTPDMLRESLKEFGIDTDVEVLALEPGESVS